jgi:UDP-N-acetylglucosamine--N-acetylmuramyl-(pentapeptide) pyrophosphoryl-undecaprenol N-acetylglucosamine transferase
VATGGSVSRRRYALVAGGGTAGHVFVVLAVARALAELGVPPEEIELVGSSRGQEATRARDQGFPLTLLPGRGIQRSLAPEALRANVGALAGLGWAVLRALVLMVRRRPRVVVSAGGYASVPAGLAAAVLRVPLVLVNVDARAGAAQRLLGHFAVASAVAFGGTGLPHPVLTGAPVRQELGALTRSPASAEAARRALGIPAERRTVVVVGGSLGARRLNEAAHALAVAWAARRELTLYHVCGERNYDALRAEPPAVPEDGSGLCYRLVAFEHDSAALYAAADVMVCRSGALTVAELGLVGVPAVLVPLPGAPGDHQRANAEALVDAGAAMLLEDHECTGERLAAVLDALLTAPGRLAEMGQAAAALGRPDAARAVATLVQAHAR